MAKPTFIFTILLLSTACGPDTGASFGDESSSASDDTSTDTGSGDAAPLDIPGDSSSEDTSDGTFGWPGGDVDTGDGDTNGMLWGPCIGAGFTGVCDPWMGNTVVCLAHPGTSICAPSIAGLDPECDTAPAGPDGTTVGAYGITCAPKCASELDCPTTMVCADPWIEVDGGACSWLIIWP